MDVYCYLNNNHGSSERTNKEEESKNMNIHACFSKIILCLHSCIKALSFGYGVNAVHSN